MLVVRAGATLFSGVIVSQTELRSGAKAAVIVTLVLSLIVAFSQLGPLSIIAIPLCAIGHIGVLLYLKLTGWPI